MRERKEAEYLKEVSCSEWSVGGVRERKEAEYLR